MADYLSLAYGAIIAQQPEERTPVWMVGEQLKDILRSEPESAQLVLQDLEVEAMGLAECEKKLRAFADKRRAKGANFSCVIPTEAEDIIRKFYGLPERCPGGAAPAPEAPAGNVLNLEDFF